MPDMTTLDILDDDPDAAPHTRLTTIADQLAGMLNAGELAPLRPATRATLADLAPTLMDIAGQITPGRGCETRSRLSVSASIIAAIRGSTCDSDLADVWRETKAHRLGLPTAEQALVVMAWIDQATALAMDDGR